MLSLPFIVFGVTLLVEVAVGDEADQDDAARRAQRSSGNIADAMNALYNEEENGVFLRIVGEGWTRPWEGCEHWGDNCSTYSRVGRLSFLVLNRLYWNARNGSLMLPQDGILEKGQTADMGFIGTEAARQRSTRCMFTVDGWSEFRFNDGCGCTTQSERYVKDGPLFNFSKHQTDGWQGDCLQPEHRDWCTALPAPRWVPLSSPTVGCPERFLCAWHANELTELMRDYKSQLEVIPRLCEHWNEVVVDAIRWNAGLPDGVWAFFIRVDKCMPGSGCHADFLRWYGEFKSRYGEKPILELDTANKWRPFALHNLNKLIELTE
mmetsp:Transcript_44435/g.102696  ORF Transcript_44435/g.102696 Transcript_44435/m.102696 type:complete len:321 (-) Transcript_44435:86-1048(-)